MPNKSDKKNILETVLEQGFPEELDPLLKCANSNQGKFNLFTAITSTYWSENLHSNLIKAFLDCNELGTLEVISSFLEYIGCSDFKDKYWNKLPPVVERESSTASDEGNGRVDVLLTFNEGKKNERVVIIENKINGAQETDKQIQKYLDHFDKKVLKVVFMPKVGYEEPKTWPNDSKYVKENLLKVIPAYSYDLEQESFQNFLTKNIDEKKFKPEYLFVIQHYIGLLKMIMNNDLSKNQKDVLTNIFNNKKEKLIALFKQVDKAKAEWDNIGTLIFGKLVEDLQNDKEGFMYSSELKGYLLLYKYLENTNVAVYLKDNSPQIEIGFYSENFSGKKEEYKDKLSSLAIVKDKDLGVQELKYWCYVDIPIDANDYESVDDAVKYFKKIATDLLFAK